LLESELFGHEKGAFTGALGLKKGKLELADGGTLFLDEIGELPATLQAKLLRAIQEREFERVGGTRPIRVDFRLIAATNRDLEAAVRAGTFRNDLFYRLSVVTLSLPPLRDRMEDLPLLAEYFVRKHEPRAGRRIRGVTPGAMTRLSRHDWPGNVRELENVIEQAIALGVDDEIVVDDLPAGLGLDVGPTFRSGVSSDVGPSSLASSPASFGETSRSGDVARSEPASLDYHQTVEETKRNLILRALDRAEQSYTGAARLLGVHPNYLHRLIRNFDLKSQIEEMARQPRKKSDPVSG
jgi:two-component system, NtrC family, response regulator HydG